ncbi:Hypothetical protein UVM_LOCUS122 [uncultured virus]|nr:Hypothetical protein UVM_LOCUS122 [uncultured virus]
MRGRVLWLDAHSNQANRVGGIAQGVYNASFLALTPMNAMSPPIPNAGLPLVDQTRPYVAMQEGDWIVVSDLNKAHVFRVSFDDLRFQLPASEQDYDEALYFELPLFDPEGNDLSLEGSMATRNVEISRLEDEANGPVERQQLQRQYWTDLQNMFSDYGPLFDHDGQYSQTTFRLFAKENGLPVQWFFSDDLGVRTEE